MLLLPILSSPEDRDSPEPGVLVLDAQTLKDLEIFTSDSGATTLYDFCNLAKTEGGARILRQRMEQPWSEASRIRGTQEALTFVCSEHDAFAKLPSAYLTNRTERYQDEVLPIMAYDNTVEFTFNAISLWANHERHYASIMLGVKITCALILALRRFVAQPELAAPTGDLAPLFEEVRGLLDRPKLAQVSDQDRKLWAWQTLRLDQNFRLYEKDSLARLLVLIYEIDALVALARTTELHNFVIPEIVSGPLRVKAEGLVHPFVEHAVANPVDLDQAQSVLFLTGPNMAGKTTYLRAFATALYLAHLGMGVPADSFSFVPAQRLFSSISLSDDLRSGISYFRAEALRVKAIAQAISEGFRVVAILDEPFKGTNVKDAFDASLAILERFAEREDCLFMFSSHLIELNDQLSVAGRIDRRNFEADESEGRLRFDYLLRVGVSGQRLGMRVLKEEGVFDLLDGETSSL